MNRDGLAKNFEKFARDWAAIRAGWREDPAQQSGWTHQYVQLFVTAARRGPYLIGHVDAVIYPAFALCLALLALEAFL